MKNKEEVFYKLKSAQEALALGELLKSYGEELHTGFYSRDLNFNKQTNLVKGFAGWICITNASDREEIELNELIELITPKPVYITEDGYKVYDFDPNVKFHWVYKRIDGKYVYLYTLDLVEGHLYLDGFKEKTYKLFTTEEAALKFIEDNNPKPWLITQDNVELFADEIVHVVTKDYKDTDWYYLNKYPITEGNIGDPDHVAETIKNGEFIYFSTEEAANKFVEENKPKSSYVKVYDKYQLKALNNHIGSAYLPKSCYKYPLYFNVENLHDFETSCLSHMGTPIEYVTWAKENNVKEYYFTTKDKVKVFEGDLVSCVHLKTPYAEPFISEYRATTDQIGDPYTARTLLKQGMYRYFKSPELAKKYLDELAPKEVENYFAVYINNRGKAMSTRIYNNKEEVEMEIAEELKKPAYRTTPRLVDYMSIQIPIV